jgi:hypothetical protein
MSTEMNPAAPHHLPMFITAPGQTDWLFNAVTVVVIVAVIGLGVLYFRLHSLPEHLAHRTTKIQYELVAVLGLLSLFTHNHIYWVAGLLLAFIQLPDFTSPLTSIAGSVEKIANSERRSPDNKAVPSHPPAHTGQASQQHADIAKVADHV